MAPHSLFNRSTDTDDPAIVLNIRCLNVFGEGLKQRRKTIFAKEKLEEDLVKKSTIRSINSNENSKSPSFTSTTIDVELTKSIDEKIEEIKLGKRCLEFEEDLKGGVLEKDEHNHKCNCKSFLEKSINQSYRSTRLPAGGKDAMTFNRRRVAETLSFVIGGWLFLLSACFGFKMLALKYNLHAPDSLAEYVNNYSTASTQWFTFAGVLLGEIALILWGHSISYMAFRRLAYGKNRTELLTFAAWNEMSRAGYTLSRRRPLWPIATIIIFIGNTFLPAGFSTLLTPKEMVVITPYNGRELDQLSPGFAAAISFMPASTFPNPANLSCGSHFVSNFWTFSSHPNVIFDPCPSLDDVQTLIMAGRAKLEASVNQSEPLFKLPGSITYVGGTGGIASLGPVGIIPWGKWSNPPSRSPTPSGYNYTYILEQQGLSCDVHCWQPKKSNELQILTTQITNIPHLLKVILRCSVDDINDVEYSFHYIGSSSIILKGCMGKNSKLEDDPDSTIMYFKDAGASLYGTQGSELGGDLICELKPRWTRNKVQYISRRKIIRVSLSDGEDSGVPNRLTGYHGELGPGFAPFSPFSEESKTRFFQYYTRLLTVQGPLSAVGNAFVFTSSLSAALNATDDMTKEYKLTTKGSTKHSLNNFTNPNDHLIHSNNNHHHKRSFSSLSTSNKTKQSHSILNENKSNRSIITLADLNQTVLFGKDSAIQSLAAFNARVNAQKVQTWIQPSQVEIFIKGVFEYAATSQREWFQHYAVDGGGWYGAISEANGTRLVEGEWRQETVGWGESTQNNSSFVFYSLIPLVCFAIISMGILGWSHWFDSPRETPYAPDIDPTDWLEAVIASSQGGLYNAFPKNVLESRKGLLEARKVRIRLGHVYEDDDEKPKMGFVCVD